MLRAGARVLALLAALLAGPAVLAQPAGDAAPPVLMIDPERLFSETVLGTRVSSGVESATAALFRENREIEAELIAEERRLTEQRSELSVEEFRALADAFDAKVQRIREEQDAKMRSVQQLREDEEQRFLAQVVPILSELVRERGALVVLDRRDVFLAAEELDITDEAIARINASLGLNAPQPPAPD